MQLENERVNLFTNLSVALAKSKIKQDKKNQKDINRLYAKEIQEYKRLHHNNEYLIVLNEEIRLNQTKDSEKQNSSNTFNGQKIRSDLNSLLFRVSDNHNHR